MGNLLNLRDASDLYVGNTKAIALYLGDNKLYHPIPDVLLWLQVIKVNSTTIVVKDMSPYNRNLTVTGSIVDTTKKKCGSIGSMRFDTANDCVLVPNNGGITQTIFTEGFTMEWWQYLDSSVSTSRGIWQLDNNGTHSTDAAEFGTGYIVTMDNNVKLFNTPYSANTYGTGNWVHFAICFYPSGGDKIKAWGNGTGNGYDFPPPYPTLSGGNLSIGNFGNNTDNFLKGNIDSFRITKGARYPVANSFTPNEQTTLLNYTADLS